MRPKEFNRNSVLEKCILLFWSDGYSATGIGKVVSYTGVNRFSLYEEFGNKEGILMASLELYIERYVPKKLPLDSSTIKEALFQFYYGFFEASEFKKHPSGCYVISMAMELREDEGMQDFLNMYLKMLEGRFSDFIKSYLSPSESDLEVTSQQLAYFYCSCMSLCVILPQQEITNHLQGNLNLITKCLNKEIKQS